MPEINPVDKSFSLEQLCESNYLRLLRLIPDLHTLEQNTVGYSTGKPTLQVEVIDKAPYTLTLQLSHCFGMEPDNFLEPAVKVKVYLDVRLVEVLRDHARPDVRRVIKDPGQSREIMNYKWSLNYFLEKWLSNCLRTDYQFQTVPEAIPVT